MSTEKKRQSDKKYYAKNKDKILAYYKTWYAQNKQINSAYKKKWYQEKMKDPKYVEKERLRKRIYGRENSDKALIRWHKRYGSDEEFRKKAIQNSFNTRYKRKKAIGRVTKQEWEDILSKFNFKCVFCGTTEKITRDHIIPISRGGENMAQNIQPLCRSCNAKKHTKLMEELTLC